MGYVGGFGAHDSCPVLVMSFTLIITNHSVKGKYLPVNNGKNALP